MKDATIVGGNIALIKEEAFPYCPSISFARLVNLRSAYVS